MKQQTIAQPIKRRASLNRPPQPSYVTDLPTRSLDTEPLSTRQRPHFLVFVGTGMLCFLVLYVLWNALVIPWWQGIEDQWQYGTARITRLDADVGHGGTSTFFAFVLNEQVIIIEAPNQNMEHAKYYRTGTLTGNYSTTPVISLSVADVDGVKSCLIVHVEGMSGSIVLYNTGSSFQMTRPQQATGG
jgi:hypothetical protein